MAALTDRLVVSGNYRVRYQLEEQRKPRELVGTYLGAGLLGGQHFDLDPVGGTASIPATALLDVELVPGATPHQAPRVVS